MLRHTFYILLTICLLMIHQSVTAQSADKKAFEAALVASNAATNPSEARTKAMLTYVKSAATREERIDRSFEVVKEVIDIDFAAVGFALYNIPRCTELDQKMRDGLPQDQQEALAEFRKWYQSEKYDTNDPSYPAGLPAAGEPWGGKVAKTITPAKDPAKEQEDCDRWVKQATMYDAQFKVGDIIYPRGRIGEFYIYDIECATHTFLAVGPNNTIRNPVSSDWLRKERGPFEMCPVCHGHFVSSHKGIVADDEWHTSSTNAFVEKRKVNGTKVANIVDYCKRCQGKGYVRKGA
ncbi:MAG: hypothetical protein JST82_15605 [Bacteroidetes bacterium]|nr:hypothetical protein [Bacteroidota bacterium]